MNVLINCEYSARARDAFLKLGHNAWSCDLLPTEGRAGNHHIGDAIEAAYTGRVEGFNVQTGREGLFFYKWDLMIAHPPCQYLCSSGLHWNKRVPGRAQKTEEALEFVQKLLDAPIEKIGLENSIGCIATRIRKPDQIIQPHWFGEDASKATCLWLKNLSPLIQTDVVLPRLVDGKERWGNQRDDGQNKLGETKDRWKIRSRTYQGIADAMAAQWG